MGEKVTKYQCMECDGISTAEEIDQATEESLGEPPEKSIVDGVGDEDLAFTCPKCGEENYGDCFEEVEAEVEGNTDEEPTPVRE